MSLEAVNWLGNKLGINISGHEGEENPSDVGHRTDFSQTEGADFYTSSNTNTMDNVKSTLGGLWKSASEKVSSMMQTNKGPTYNDLFGGGGGSPTTSNAYQQQQQQEQQQLGGYSMNTGGGGGGAYNSGARDNEAGENTELDENGFPVAKNWYYFDKELNRWNVTPDAPESIRRDYERKLQEAEDERLGVKKVVAPPPPPGASRPPGAAPLPAQGGLFHGNATGGSRPMYAVPDYFGNSSAPQQQQQPQQQPPMQPPPQQQQQQHQQQPAYSSYAPQSQPPKTQQQQQQQGYPQPQQQQVAQQAQTNNYTAQPAYQGQMSYNAAPAQRAPSAQTYNSFNASSSTVNSTSGNYPAPPQQCGFSQSPFSVHSTPNPNPTNPSTTPTAAPAPTNATGYANTQPSAAPPSAPPPRPAAQNPPQHALSSGGAIANRYAPSPFDTAQAAQAAPPSSGMNTFHPPATAGIVPRAPQTSANSVNASQSPAYNVPPPSALSGYSASSNLQTQGSYGSSAPPSSAPLPSSGANVHPGVATTVTTNTYPPANNGNQNMNPFATQPSAAPSYTNTANASTGNSFNSSATTAPPPHPVVSNTQAPSQAEAPPTAAPGMAPNPTYRYTGMNYTSSGNAAPPAFKPFAPK